MRPGRVILLAVFLAACGRTPVHVSGPDGAARALGGDAANIRSMMFGNVGYGGLHFADAACQQQFLVAREIRESELDAFARCLAGLHLASDGRASWMSDFAILAYAPGIEVEARFFLEDPRGTQLLYIGYVGSADGHPTLPTVTPAALEAMRVAGDPHPHLDDDDTAWFKVCVDLDGAVTGVHAVAASSTEVIAPLASELAEWKFQPIELDGAPSPVCSWIELAGASIKSLGYVPVAPLDPDAAVGADRTRIDGNVDIQPTDKEKVLIKRAHVASLHAGVRYCVDPAGTVSKIAVYTSSGLPLYDSILTRNILQWRFAPADAEACNFVIFTYVQR